MTRFDMVLQFRAYTTRAGYRQLDEALRMHNTLYNAALQNRRDAWKMRRENISYNAPEQGVDRTQAGLPRVGGPAPPAGLGHPEAS